MHSNDLKRRLSWIVPICAGLTLAACGGGDSGGGSGGSGTGGSGTGGSGTGGSGTGGSAGAGTGGSAGAGTGGSGTGGSAGAGTGGSGTGGSAGAGTGGSGGGSAGAGSACDFTGTWATYIEIDVSWPAGTLKAGKGKLKQYLLSDRVMDLPNNKATDSGKACMTELPPFATIFNSWTGASFPPALFDTGSLPSAALTAVVTPQQPPGVHPGDSFTIAPVGLLMGLQNLPDSTPWPNLAGIAQYTADQDPDGHPGITVTPRTGQVPGQPAGTMFSNPQINLLGSAHADQLGIVSRTLAGLSGQATSCDRLDGKVVTSTLKIQSHNVWCHVEGGADCTTGANSQNTFVDNNLPQFQPVGTSKLISVRVAGTTTCADVRAMTFN